MSEGHVFRAGDFVRAANGEPMTIIPQQAGVPLARLQHRSEGVAETGRRTECVLAEEVIALAADLAEARAREDTLREAAGRAYGMLDAAKGDGAAEVRTSVMRTLARALADVPATEPAKEET